MTRSTTSFTWFDPDTMPDKLAVFPLSGVILLPRARLPLNVFEPRYLSMVQDVLGMPGRMIGIVQPSDVTTPGNAEPKLYNVGCVGRITSFNETEDGRFLISLTGVCRFAVREELDVKLPYRMVKPDWSAYADDFDEPADEEIDRDRLMEAIKRYFKMHDIAADWTAVQGTPTDALIASLVMIAPLAPNEKQALLESPNLNSRAEMLTTLMEMAIFPRGEAEGSKH